MADRIEAYAHALLEIARAEGHLSEIEDEMFRFARIVEGNDELRMAIADPGLPVDRRSAIVDELLEGRALAVTRAAAAFIVGAGRGHDFPAIVTRFTELAAQSRERELAEVRSAIPLDDAKQQQLAEALSRATGKRVEVKVVVYPAASGLQALIDHEPMKQVLVNLTGNAIEAMGEAGGSLRIELEHEDQPSPAAVIRIVDSGPGIPVDIAGRIFDPFFTTKPGVGTGLGLAISRRIAVELGGVLDVDRDSHLGGAVFRLSLPAQPVVSPELG